MKKRYSIPQIIPFIIIAFACLILLLPLMHKGLFVSDDGNWMVIRLTAFYQSFREGQFPVRFLGRLNQSYGYPVANFLYPGFLYAGSALRVMGFSFIHCIKLLLAGSVIGTAIFIFLWLRIFFSPLASAIGVLGLLFAPYFSFDIYKRGSIGEIFALCWVAMGIFSIDAKKKWLFALAVALLTISHNTLALLFIGMFFLYLVYTNRIRQHLYPLFLGIGMATFFWFPAISEIGNTIFDTVNISNAKSYLLGGNMIFLVGLVQLFSVIIALYIGKTTRQKVFMIVTLCISTLLVLPVSSILWNISFLSKIIQFPYRLLSLGLIVGPWLISYVLDAISQKAKIFFIVVCVMVWIFGLGVIFKEMRYVIEPEGYYTTNESTTTIHNEYMPRWVTSIPTKRSEKRVSFHQGNGVIQYNKISTQYIDVTVQALEDSVIQIDTMYYPGWGVIINDRQVDIDYHNPQGLMRIDVPKGTYRLVAAFRETIPRFLADIVSGVCFVLFLLYCRVSIAKRHSK